MPTSVDSALNKLQRPVRALKREDRHVFMLDASRRHLLGAAKEERRRGPDVSRRAYRTMPARRV
jgi:hypothetical protein